MSATNTEPEPVTVLDHKVGPYGYGLMGLTWRPNPCPTSQAFTAMRAALDQGATFWNGGEFYGPPERNSLVLLNEYFQKYPEDADKILINIKGGMVPGQMKSSGTRENTRRTVEDSLAQLQKNGVTKTLDIFEFARVDPDTPIEETISYLAELVQEGKIKGIGLSEVRAETIKRAAKIHAIASVEVEMSLWTPDILSNGIATTCAEHNIPILAYSPLGRGALTGNMIQSNAEIAEDDYRKHQPRFQDDVLKLNNKIVHEVSQLADRKGVTLPQIALAWVRAHSNRIITDPTQNNKQIRLGTFIPIPGATTEERVRENIRPDIVLSDDEFEELNRLVRMFPVEGHRYPEALRHMCDG